MTTITTARLHMRPFTGDDESSLVRLHGDAGLMAHFRGGVQNSVEAAAELVRYGECWAAHGVGIWALFTEGVFIGECGLRLPDGDAQGLRLRFIIDKPYWGRGFASEAVAASLGFAFETAAIGLIRAVARERNPASQRVLERAGLTVEKHSHTENGEEIRIYAITSAAWRAIRLKSFITC